MKKRLISMGLTATYAIGGFVLGWIFHANAKLESYDWQLDRLWKYNAAIHEAVDRHEYVQPPDWSK